MSEQAIVNYPICGKPIVRAEVSPFRPFCSGHCQLIDPGKWVAEGKRIPNSGDLLESNDWSKEQK